MRSDAPKGFRYSAIYLEKDAPAQDSDRARKRLAAYFKNDLYEHGDVVWSHLEKELGADSKGGYDHTKVAKTILEADQVLFLDVITEIYRSIADQARLAQSRQIALQANAWQSFTHRVFAEEALAFEVDAQCGVHPLVDQAYVTDRTAVIAGLGAPQYSSGLTHYEAAMERFSGADPELGPAIREVFLSAEAVFKAIFPAAPRLEVSEINKRLKPALASIMAENERHAVSLCLTGFGNWVSAAHHYRHADREPESPSIESAVLLISTGSGFIRWMIAFANKISSCEQN